MNARLRAVEERLSEIEKTLADQTHAQVDTFVPSKPGVLIGTSWPSLAIRIAAFLMLDFLLGLLFGGSSHLHFPDWAVLLLLVLNTVPDVGLGVWLGSRQSVGWKFGLVLGLVRSFVGGVLWLFADGWAEHISIRETFTVSDTWAYLYLPFSVAFVSCFCLARWRAIRKNRSSTSERVPVISKGLGKALLTRGRAETESSFDERVRQLNAVVGALAPILTLIGSICVGLLGLYGKKPT